MFAAVTGQEPPSGVVVSATAPEAFLGGIVFRFSICISK